MKDRYRAVLRGSRGVFYCVDTRTGKRTSLGTSDRKQAAKLIAARNQADEQPALNLQLARTYMAGADGSMVSRTWADALRELTATKQGANQHRWRTVAVDKALAPLWPKIITETRPEDLLHALNSGCVSTNIYLRRLHNFCLGMNWLPWPIIPKLQWPPVRFKQKRAITADEHARIIARERNPERKAFYQLAWYLGASQSDLAYLDASNVDWESRTITFERMKVRWRNVTPAQIRFGSEVAAILKTRPEIGPLFPYLRSVEPGHRATEFRQRCLGLGIRGVSLHSYRYAWAERAKVAGYPERFAQLALGHNSKAVHRAYARKAQVSVPALEDYEKNAPGKALELKPAATA